VLYTNRNAEDFGAAYPYGLGKLPNIELKQQPIPSATLGGTNVSPTELRSRLAHASRVWVVEIDQPKPVDDLVGLSYTQLFTWRTSDIWLELYVCKGSAAFLPDLRARHMLVTSSASRLPAHSAPSASR